MRSPAGHAHPYEDSRNADHSGCGSAHPNASPCAAEDKKEKKISKWHRRPRFSRETLCGWEMRAAGHGDTAARSLYIQYR